MPAQANSQ